MDTINQASSQQPYQPPVTPPASEPKPKTPLFAAFVAGAVVLGLGILAWSYFSSPPTASPTPSATVSVSSSPPSATPFSEASLNEIFGMAQKTAGTKLYYSEKLGIGFSYAPGPYTSYNYVTKIRESGNTIHVETWGNPEGRLAGENTLEVFSKDPAETLAQAVTSKFLAGYDPKICWVVSQESRQGLSSYESATISIRGGGMEDLLSAQTNCPKAKDYMVSTYFAMNAEIPDTFFAVKLGQDAPVDDGTPTTGNDRFGWDHSIRVLK